MSHRGLIAHPDALGYPENTIAVFMEPVEANLKIDIYNYYYACSEANCQSYNVDKGEPLVSPEVSDGRNKIVSDHNLWGYKLD